MTAKSLYHIDDEGTMRRGSLAQTYESSEQIPFYTSSIFIGRDQGEKYRASPGLTKWVAENFELLDLGEPPYDSRDVNSLTRARWEQCAMDFLERWMPRHATRHVIRRTMDGLSLIHI